jgi:hypothetical protein
MLKDNIIIDDIQVLLSLEKISYFFSKDNTIGYEVFVVIKMMLFIDDN